MMSLEKVLKRERMCKALTGLSPKEFINLAPTFAKALEEAKMNKYLENPNRQRKPGGGKKSFVPTPEEKLFFILFYFKCYPTFDLAGFFYNRDGGNIWNMYSQLVPILESALGKKMTLPVRSIGSIDEFFAVFPEAKDVFIDGTERPIQRPKDKQRQKANYSGKKKRHTRKNIVVTNRKRKIGVLTKTVEGKEHDFSIVKKERLPDHIPKDVRIQVDNGFQGIQKEFPGHLVSITTKKPKGRELSNTVKEHNKSKSRVRILVEHAIGGIKRYGIVSQVFRNRTKDSDDTAIYLSSGRWNYHLAETG